MANEILKSRVEGSRLIVETSQGTETYDSKFMVAALLVFVARGSGQIEPEESAKMIELIEEHFHLPGPEALELLTTVIAELSDKPALATLLTGLGPTLSDSDKEEVALMGLKVVAADGHREISEMEQFNKVMASVGISPETVHRAFDRYFAETGTGV